jgi:hypothetical protein
MRHHTGAETVRQAAVSIRAKRARAAYKFPGLPAPPLALCSGAATGAVRSSGRAAPGPPLLSGPSGQILGPLQRSRSGNRLAGGRGRAGGACGGGEGGAARAWGWRRRRGAREAVQDPACRGGPGALTRLEGFTSAGWSPPAGGSPEGGAGAAGVSTWGGGCGRRADARSTRPGLQPGNRLTAAKWHLPLTT